MPSSTTESFPAAGSASANPIHQLRSSIFTKLIAVSVGTGVVISAAVAWFFFTVMRPLLLTVPVAQQAEIRAVHDRLLVALLMLLVVIIVAGHAMLRRILAPVRWLEQGVASLSGGNLGVNVPRRTNDELGALTDAFNRMVGNISEMVRARDQLLLDVSHELRSPLTRMKLALALCENSEHTARLSANVNEMEVLVTELLEIERLRQGRGLQLQEHDLMEIVRDAVSTFRDVAPGVRLAAAPERLLLSVDADKVRTVLGNLLENASKYAMPDSSAARVFVDLSARAILLRITDDGPGIPEPDLQSLFEPFYRVDRSRSKRTGGWGLGLSLCKRIMAAHGGSIEVQNNPERGATFTLSFPCKSSPIPNG